MNNNLKEIRRENSKTQLELAQLLNIAKSTYCGYELGTSEPTIDTLCKLADYYGVSLDYLVGRNFGNEFGYMSPEEKALVTSFRKLSDVNKIKVSSYTFGVLSTQE